MIFKWILALTVTLALTGCEFQRKRSGTFTIDGETFRYELTYTDITHADTFEEEGAPVEIDDFVYKITFPDGTTTSTDQSLTEESATENRDRLAKEWLAIRNKEPGLSDTIAGPPEDPADVPTVGLPETKDSN